MTTDKMTRLPVSALEHNVIDEFERIAAQSNHCFESSVVDGKVCPVINLLLDRIAPKGPYADMNSRKINIYESHLAFIWSFIYSSFVIYEEGVQKKMINGLFNNRIIFDNILLRRAKSLQDWAISFSSNFDSWDTYSLPNPMRHFDDQEKFYVECTNKIFLQAVSFLLFHEYAHLSLTHERIDDDRWSLDQEKDADNFAFSFFIDDSVSEKSRQITGLAIVFLYMTNFFLSKNIRGIWQNRHPHLHDRLKNGIASLNLSERASKYYIYHLASITLQTYLQSKGISVQQVASETAEDLFFEYLDKIDEFQGGDI